MLRESVQRLSPLTRSVPSILETGYQLKTSAEGDRYHHKNGAASELRTLFIAMVREVLSTAMRLNSLSSKRR